MICCATVPGRGSGTTCSSSALHSDWVKRESVSREHCGALIQSPAFEYDLHVHGDRLRKTYRATEARPTRIFIDVGTLYDQLAQTRDFRDILRKKGYTLEYVEVNEGHSWGHWRAWIDDGLAYLLAP